ncbi:MAG: ABC transporter substrate-binding protein [Halanaerobiales bacterium]
MNLLKNSFVFMIALSLLLALPVMAQEEEKIDPEIPENWYEAPETASESGIDEFSESPMLEEKVEEGELPPVEERLPDDPPVIENYSEVGEYGGTATIWSTDFTDWEVKNWKNFGGVRITPDGNLVPSYIKDWEYSNDYKDFTIHLREGLKFSDGSPLTADDYIFWWEHVAQNSKLTSAPPEDWNPALLDVEKEDEYTVTYKFGSKVPKMHYNLRVEMGAATSVGTIIAPDEVMKEIHPDFIGEEEATELAEDKGYNNWFDYYNRVEEEARNLPEYYERGILNPYIPVEKNETTLILERNPYYPFVDSEGNQLPYIDRVKVELANNREMAATKASTGEADFASEHLKASDIPLYKRNEQNEDYTTNIFSSPFGSSMVFYLNYTHEDPEYRELFQDVDFRRAISLGIDREEINDKVYFGRAEARQVTVPPVNEFYKEEYARSYAEYDPDKANEMLDEIGMVDVDDDGWRETPDGEDFNPTLIYTEYELDPTPILELVKDQWEEIGINIDVKMMDFGLWLETWPTNTSDMTVWSNNGGMGMRFRSFDGLCEFAPVIYPEYVQWPEYVKWYTSDGENGEEPPEEIKKTTGWAETIVNSPDEREVEEAADKLLQSMADNLWVIGTVGLPPKPVIVGDTLKNVPQTGYWGTSTENSTPYHFEQFYLDE